MTIGVKYHSQINIYGSFWTGPSVLLKLCGCFGACRLLWTHVTPPRCIHIQMWDLRTDALLWACALSWAITDTIVNNTYFKQKKTDCFSRQPPPAWKRDDWKFLWYFPGASSTYICRSYFSCYIFSLSHHIYHFLQFFKAVPFKTCTKMASWCKRLFQS